MNIKKTFDLEVKEKNPTGGRITISTPSVDRDRDRVFPMGARVDNYMKNPVVQWGHNYKEPWATIGRTDRIEVTPEGINVEFTLREPANDQDPQNIVILLWEGGWINTASVGFAPAFYVKEDAVVENEFGGHDYNDWDLLEWSMIPIPANQDALRLAVKSLDGETPEDEVVAKGAIPYSVHGSSAKAPEGRSWSGSGARSRLKEWAGESMSKYKKGFSEVRGDPDNYGSYKGPHHDIIDGKFMVVWSGVRSAMGTLVFGARSGRISDDSVRRGVYNHLKQHYGQFDKEVPEYKDYTYEEVKALFPELYKDTEPNTDDTPQPDTDANTEDNRLDEATLERLEQFVAAIRESLEEMT